MNKTENRDFDAILADEQAEIEFVTLPDLLLESIMTEAHSAVESDQEYHKNLDENRDWFDKKVFKTAKDTGGQLMFPQLDKLTQGFRHPDGSPKAKQGVDPDQLLITDAVTRELVSHAKINNEWRRHSKDVATDALALVAVSVDDQGLPFAKFTDPKRVHFEADAEGLHIKDKAKSANWSFWFEEGEVTKLKDSYEEIYPDRIGQINEGTPMSKDDDDETDFHQTEEDKDGEKSRKMATILHVICLSSPVSGTFGTGENEVTIERGEPFEIKLVGDAKAVLSVATGDDFVHRWANTNEPYQPYVAFYHSYLRKGMHGVSYVQKVMPYINEIIYLRRVGKRNLKLVGEALQIANITGDSANSIKNELIANVKRDVSGKKKSHVVPLSSKNLKIDMMSTAPTELNQGAIDNRINDLKMEVNEIIQIMTDGIANNNQEKVGVRRFREEAQNGAVGLFQENNFEQFKILNRMFLNVLLTVTGQYVDKTVEVGTGIDDDESGEEFKIIMSLDEALEIMTPDVLSFDWNFSPILPTGGVQAAAEEEAIVELQNLNEIFPENPEIQNAILSQSGKRIQSVAGTDAFNPTRALQYHQQRMQQAEAAAQAQSGNPMQGAENMAQNLPPELAQQPEVV